jgi:hypothetical protein
VIRIDIAYEPYVANVCVPVTSKRPEVFGSAITVPAELAPSPHVIVAESLEGGVFAFDGVNVMTVPEKDCPSVALTAQTAVAVVWVVAVAPPEPSVMETATLYEPIVP